MHMYIPRTSHQLLTVDLHDRPLLLPPGSTAFCTGSPAVHFLLAYSPAAGHPPCTYKHVKYTLVQHRSLCIVHVAVMSSPAAAAALMHAPLMAASVDPLR